MKRKCVHEPGPIRLLLAALVLPALFPAACATTPEDPNAPRACVVVDNETGSGTHSRIFLVSTLSGWRLGMGEVGMAVLGRVYACTRVSYHKMGWISRGFLDTWRSFFGGEEGRRLKAEG